MSGQYSKEELKEMKAKEANIKVSLLALADAQKKKMMIIEIGNDGKLGQCSASLAAPGLSAALHNTTVKAVIEASAASGSSFFADVVNGLSAKSTKTRNLRDLVRMTRARSEWGESVKVTRGTNHRYIPNDELTDDECMKVLKEYYERGEVQLPDGVAELFAESSINGQQVHGAAAVVVQQGKKFCTKAAFTSSGLNKIVMKKFNRETDGRSNLSTERVSVKRTNMNRINTGKKERKDTGAEEGGCMGGSTGGELENQLGGGDDEEGEDVVEEEPGSRRSREEDDDLERSDGGEDLEKRQAEMLGRGDDVGGRGAGDDEGLGEQVVLLGGVVVDGDDDDEELVGGGGQQEGGSGGIVAGGAGGGSSSSRHYNTRHRRDREEEDDDDGSNAEELLNSLRQKKKSSTNKGRKKGNTNAKKGATKK